MFRKTANENSCFMKTFFHNHRYNRKLRKALPVICSVLLLLVLFLLFRNPLRSVFGRFFSGKSAAGSLEGPYSVAYVYDGDTIAVLIDNEEVTVRMIGIDTPESVNRDSSKNTPEGMEASLWLHDRLKGRMVLLEYNEQLTDRYGRRLAYIWLEDEQTMLEEELLKNGLAVTLTIEPNVRYGARFSKIEQEARTAKVGFWGTGFFK